VILWGGGVGGFFVLPQGRTEIHPPPPSQMGFAQSSSVTVGDTSPKGGQKLRSKSSPLSRGELIWYNIVMFGLKYNV